MREGPAPSNMRILEIWTPACIAMDSGWSWRNQRPLFSVIMFRDIEPPFPAQTVAMRHQDPLRQRHNPINRAVLWDIQNILDLGNLIKILKQKPSLVLFNLTLHVGKKRSGFWIRLLCSSSSCNMSVNWIIHVKLFY